MYLIPAKVSGAEHIAIYIESLFPAVGADHRRANDEDQIGCGLFIKPKKCSAPASIQRYRKQPDPGESSPPFDYGSSFIASIWSCKDIDLGF